MARRGAGDDEAVDRDRQEEGEAILAGVASQVEHVNVAGHRGHERHRDHGACRCPAHGRWHIGLDGLAARSHHVRPVAARRSSGGCPGSRV
jgi:hypothetical protein